MKVIIENQILSPIEIYSLFKKSKKIIIERFDNYNKRTYRNRFFILSSNGVQMLSIPLKKGKNNKLSFSDVEISYDVDWVSVFIKTLRNCYGASPYFNYYYQDIVSIFNKKYRFLYELNTILREHTFNILDLDVQIEYSEEYLKSYPDDFLDLRDKILPKKSLILKGNRTLKYSQVFEERIGYINNPSVLDLIFNMGKYGLEYL